MYAVIKTGGKQYRAAAGDTLQIEKLEGGAGDAVAFSEVLMLVNGGTVEVGAPFVTGATVMGEISSHDRGPKIIIFKKRRRKHYRRKNGHRQDLTSVTITGILTGGAKPEMKTAAPAVEEAAPAPAVLAEMPAGEAPQDDISLIGGIGPKIHKALTELGIATYAQIAAWSAEDVANVETAIKQKGRVGREEWIEQAAELMAGKPPRAKTDKTRKQDE